ncbi:hypothetical protein BDM02DRAFT_3143647 [Thelephora ganbajun]|uniref:Uncharacterized protein n=1 Tax=Thelephora ganbajun TaxID=370292 RepID=A0ACB6ZGR3_THEGA|nr:hypothetical protein BDM02DRAFT_3143647 [Thelephora ganbajun]
MTWFKSLGHQSSRSQPQLQSPTTRQDLCETCGKRPKFVEKDGTVHPYCGRTCAKAQQPTCKLPGCKESGRSAFSGFCSPRHARSAVQIGQSTPCHRCGKHPQVIGGLCLQCNNQGDSESRLRELKPRDPKLISSVASVVQGWKGVGVVEVHKVYEIFLPKDVYAAREVYRWDTLGDTNQIRTFYGAQCICDLGVTNNSLCNWKSCGICSIIKSSFTAFEFGATSNSGRYGEGIYSYFDPSMADRFATSSVSSPYRAMLACDVNLEDEDRMFVSSARAIIPRFVILYTKGA